MTPFIELPIPSGVCFCPFPFNNAAESKSDCLFLLFISSGALLVDRTVSWFDRKILCLIYSEVISSLASQMKSVALNSIKLFY